MKRPLVFALSLVPALASAEERSFAVTIDGKPAGKVVHSFKAETDGSTAVLCDAQIDEPSGYPFVYRGTEVWKDGRLVRLDGAGAQGGPKGGVTLRPGTDGHHLKTRTNDVTVRGEVWPNSFAVLPDLDRAAHVVDVLTGEVLRAKVEKVGPDRITVSGKPVPATRYRLTVGGSRTDLWYDTRGRLVRRAWSWDGRPAVLELTRLTGD